MDSAIDHLGKEFATLRTGKASPALVENLLVEAYGATMKLNELANITAPEPRMLAVQPFDASNANAIEKAIKESRLGLNPINDGKLIRLPIPALTGERRQELTKQAKAMAEEAKVSVRSQRRSALDAFKKAEKESELTEDDLRSLEKQVQDATDKYTKKIDDLTEAKVNDIMQV